jgi:hypothetical protein
MKKLVIFFTFFITAYAGAQTEADIRKHYQEVNKQITESIDLGAEGPLYRTQWIANSHGKSWPAVGRYTDTVNFWYDDPPNHLPASERDPKKVLLKIEINGISADTYIHEEFLFRNGVLIFHFYDEKVEGFGLETRVWFNSKGIAIKKSVKGNELEILPTELEYKSIAPNPANILKKGKKYQDLFVKSMM